ncbi:M48 family metallopeptidase [Candidatus Saganbacteria bacterium]|nr:M48 family metallopeptidase [Candidatus Saganbacteria bacterium]
MDINIIRSHKRRRTVSARLVDNILHVSAPQHIPADKLDQLIEEFKTRLEKRLHRKELNAQVNLHEVAEKLNQKYFAGQIKFASIAYSTRQTRVFGNCNWRNGSIHISSVLAKMPPWVRDYVVVHELAHILEPNHRSGFWALVNRYPLAERARGFLLAKGWPEEEDSDLTDDHPIC